MLRSLFLLPLLFSPAAIVADSVDVTATVTQPDPNTYCVSGVCLSINGGSTTPTSVRYHTLDTETSTITAQGETSTTTETSWGDTDTTTSTETSLDGSITFTSTTSGGITTTTSTSTGHHEPTKKPKPTKPPKHGQNPGTSIGYGPTQAPGQPGTVVVQNPPTCDVCESGVLVFYMQPTCCPDGSVCDIAGLLTSGPLKFPEDCGNEGSAAITFNACTCTFYCNSTLGHGGAPTQPPTLPPTTVAPTAAPTTLAPTLAPTTLAPTTLAPTTLAPTTQAPTTPAPTTQAPTTQAPTQAPTTKAPTTLAPTTLAPTVPNGGNNPTQSPSCSRCNATHVFFVVFPVCCTNQAISLCNNNQIANAAKNLPSNCDENSITWDGCSCNFYCNTTSATVTVNPNHPGSAPVLPVPQSEVQTSSVDIHFNITQPNNHTHCIAGTSICITINSASQNTMTTFPIIASVIMGLLAML